MPAFHEGLTRARGRAHTPVCPGSGARRAALGRESVVVVLSALCCYCPVSNVRQKETSPVLKHFEGQKMPVSLLLLHFRSVLSYYDIITLLSYHPQCDISGFGTGVLTSNSRSFTSQNLQLSLAWKQV